ncbi:MAG: PAS domain-containing protein [Lachnospiraceae bacterium]|uniref:sensor histidine kinase n=1 Tax=uncultured Acetatifactor sp. TaxID=1671927 RepID=UPI0026386EAA|nr:ATP-binding protein [uncultured Acetatifactor sp.]MCI8788507.1 PAS domain-containing protein [Lachnospiraceae bacterium]
MTKRIFRSICLAALGVFLSSAVLFMGVVYDYFSGVQHDQLRMQTQLAAQGAANEGSRYFEGLEVEGFRITWIGAKGEVLYDSASDSAEMENHMERDEIREAFAGGSGESSRYSVTLLERAIYCAERLPDGTVLRLSMAQNTPLTLFLGILQPVCIVFAVAVLLSLFLAFRLSRAIVKPLNELDLDQPLMNQEYEEIAPLLKRMSQQQRQIRKQREELRRRQSEFETVTTGMAEGIVLLNGNKVILSINPAALRLFGTDRSCEGKYILSVNRSLQLQELLQKAGDGRHAEMVMELNGGTYQLAASPVFSEGLVSGVVLLMLDVTEKEKAEQLRREFTANVSHELKTPLHTISGSAELMAEGMVRNEDIPVFSRRIYAESQRMIRLVEDIIRLSHLDEGAGDMKWEEMDLHALAEENINVLMPEAKKRGIQVDLAGETVWVRGIRQLVSGIFYNLIDNAIKYNHREGSVRVTVEAERAGASVCVADTGIGIPAEHQERIFERFYRVDKSHSKEIGGTGLGLSIVKHAAKLHGAAIQVDSIVGEGTAIKIHFTGILQ